MNRCAARAGVTSARGQIGAAEVVDPRPHAVGSLRDTLEKYPHIGRLLPAMGYYPEQVADIERVRRLLGQERLTVIGHSFGGFIATLYAVEFPERVDRLILVSPWLPWYSPPPGDGLVPK